MNMPATPIAVSGAPEAAAQLIQHGLGVEIRAIDKSSASGRDDGGQVVSLRDLRQLGQTDKGAPTPAAREAAKRRASDALSEAEKRAYTRKLRLIAHCKALFVAEPKTANKEIFSKAARIMFEEEQKRAGDNLNMCAAKPVSDRTVQAVWRTYERSNRDVRSLMPRFRDRGRKMAALKDKVNLLVRATLYELWLTEKPVGIEQVQRAVETEIKRRSAAGEDGFVGEKRPGQR